MNPLAVTARRLWYDGHSLKEIAQRLDVRHSSVNPVLQQIVLYRRFHSVRKTRVALVAKHGIAINMQFWHTDEIVRTVADAATDKLRLLADAVVTWPRSLVHINVQVRSSSHSFLDESGATPAQLHNIADYVDGLKRQAGIIL